MKSPPTGYRDFTLPDGLCDLDQHAPHPQPGDLRLIHRGRTTLIWAQSLTTGERSVLKMYLHRGPVDWWREKHFRFRVQREYDSLTRLDQCGLRCSKPLFWWYGSEAPYGRFEILATREIPDAQPVSEFLKDHGSQPTIIETLHPLFTMIANMHQHGIHHGALYLRNILVNEEKPGQWAFHLIDTPNAIAFPCTIVGTRTAQIDLLNLCHEIARQLDIQACAPLLMLYGLTKQATADLVERVKRHRPSRHSRNRHRTEGRLRKLVSWP